jgi:MFS family permease
LSDSRDTHSEFWRIVVILSLVAIVIEYAETMLFPAIPDIIADFKSSYSNSSWVLSGYLIAAAVMAPLVGKLSDIYGKKKVLSIIMTIFVASIAIAGFSKSIETLIGVRIVQGIGLSMFIIALSIMQSNVPKEKYALANGILASAYFSGSSIGLVLGGVIIHYFEWRTVFFSLIPIVIIILAIVIRFLHVKGEQDEEQQDRRNPYSIPARYDGNRNEAETRDMSNKNDEKKKNNSDSGKNNRYFVPPLNVKHAFFKSLDITGVITLAVTITLFLTSLTYMENYDSNENAGDYNSIFIIGLASGAILSLILFLTVEKKAVSPLVNLRLIANKTIFPVLIMFLILGFTMFMVYQTIPILVRAPAPLGFEGSSITSSLVLLPFTIVFLALSPTVSILVRKFGSMKLFMAGSVISAVGYFSIFLFHSTELEVSITLTIVSSGLALLNTVGMSIVMLSTPKRFGGVIIGMVQVLMFAGMSTGPVVGGIFMERNQESIDGILTSYPSALAYDLIFLTASIASLSFVALAIILKMQKNLSNLSDPIHNQ